MSKPKNEFKQKVMESSYVRDKAAEVYREPVLNPSVLGRWRREAKKYGESSFPGKGSLNLPMKKGRWRNSRKTEGSGD